MNDRGIVLIFTLGFLLVMSFSAFQLHRVSSRRMEQMRAVIDLTQARFLSKAGLLLGEEYLKADKNSYDWPGEDWAQGLNARTPKGKIVVNIQDENGKLNLAGILQPGGKTDTKLLEITKRFFLQLGYSESLVDCLLDWIDEDDMPRVFGAESTYYSGLARPYRPANRNPFSPEELGFIKGFTSEVMSGNEEEGIPGILDLVTVYTDSKINVNTCSPVLLRALGFSEANVSEITTERTTRPLEENYLMRINKEAYLACKSHVVFKSKFFSVTSDGTTENGKHCRMRLILEKDKGLKTKSLEYL